MMLDHEGLEVYQVALDFLVMANAIIEGLPRGRGHLSDQFTRASLSICVEYRRASRKVLQAGQATLLPDRAMSHRLLIIKAAVSLGV
jgi:hypothetical protein